MKQQMKLAAVVSAVALALVGCTTAGQSPAPASEGASETAAPEAQSLGRLDIIAPAAPGSGWDQTARAIGAALEAESMVDSATITNVPGASGTVALAQLAGQEGDEDTLVASGLAMMSGVLTNDTGVTLDDLTPIARMIGEGELIVVPADSEFQTLDDLMTAIAENPSGVAIAGGSAGSADHVFLGLLAQEYDIEPSAVNYVPYSGGGEATTALLGSQVAAGISGVGEFAEQVRTGALRALVVSTAEPIEGIDAPTIAEAGYPDLEFTNWRSIMAPAGISDERRDAYIAALTTLVESDTWTETIETNQWLDQFLPGDEFDAWLDEENERVGSVLDDLGLVVGS